MEAVIPQCMYWDIMSIRGDFEGVSQSSLGSLKLGQASLMEDVSLPFMFGAPGLCALVIQGAGGSA